MSRISCAVRWLERERGLVWARIAASPCSARARPLSISCAGPASRRGRPPGRGDRGGPPRGGGVRPAQPPGHRGGARPPPAGHPARLPQVPPAGGLALHRDLVVVHALRGRGEGVGALDVGSVDPRPDHEVLAGVEAPRGAARDGDRVERPRRLLRWPLGDRVPGALISSGRAGVSSRTTRRHAVAEPGLPR